MSHAFCDNCLDFTNKSDHFSNLACRLERNLKEMTTNDPDIRKHALVKIHFIAEAATKIKSTHSSLLAFDVAQRNHRFNKPFLHAYA